MTGFLAEWYLWIKAGHVIAVVAWMAGLFYLPRLYVYHVEAVEPGSKSDAMFQGMERRLYRGIMAPAMGLSWLFGLCLVLTPGVVDWGMAWPWTKAAAVLAMSGFHGWLGVRGLDFAGGRNAVSGRAYRLMNELPTLLLVVIVVSVIVKF